MLYDEQAPEELKNKSSNPSTVGWVVWASFKNDEESHTEYLNFDHPYINEEAKRKQIEDFKHKMGNFYIKVLDRAWKLTKTKYIGIFTDERGQVPKEINHKDLLLDPSLCPLLTIPA